MVKTVVFLAFVYLIRPTFGVKKIAKVGVNMRTGVI